MNWNLNLPQAKAWNNAMSGNFRHVAIGGGIRSGKSYFNIWLMCWICMNHKGARCAIIRCSSAQLSRTTEPTLLKIIEEGVRYYAMDPRKPYNFGNKSITFKNGSKLMLIAENYANDKKGTQWLGMELNCIGFEEANELQPASIEMACTRLGSWRGSPGCPAFAVYTFNPCKGYIKERFYDRLMNGTLPKNESFTLALAKDNKKNLGDDYFKILEEMPEKQKRVFVDGDWEFVDSVGLAFTNWNFTSTMPSEYHQKSYGLDWGWSPSPQAIVEVRMVKDGKKNKYFLREISYALQQPVEEIPPTLWSNGYEKERVVCDSANPEKIYSLRKLGINAISCATKNALSQIYALQSNEIYLFKESKNLVKEFENAHLGVDSKFIPSTVDHLLDASAYNIRTVF